MALRLGPLIIFGILGALCGFILSRSIARRAIFPPTAFVCRKIILLTPENRYKTNFKIQVELPDSISEKDKLGILRSIDRCSVKRTIQNNPEFIIEAVDNIDADTQGLLSVKPNENEEHFIAGKDASLEQTIRTMTQILADIGIKIEIASWRNIVPHVWSLHLREASSPMCFTNGKGATKEAVLCSALGEYIDV